MPKLVNTKKLVWIVSGMGRMDMYFSSEKKARVYANKASARMGMNLTVSFSPIF